MAKTLGEYNPLRYRGYVFDQETGLYYLPSRYYNPELGRFINADAFTSTGQGLLGNNMFAYCGNNPVSRTDTSGEFWNIVAGAVIGGLTSFVGSILTNVVACIIEGKEINVETVDLTGALISAGFGAITGAAVAMCPAAGSLFNSMMGACDALVDGVRNNEDMTTVLTNVVVSAGIGAVTGSWGSDFANVSLLDDAVNAFARRAAGNHPAVKDAANKLIRQAGKYLLGAITNGMREDIPCSFLEWGTQKVLEVVI